MANQKTKKILVLVFIAAASAAVISLFIFFLPQLYGIFSRVPHPSSPSPSPSSGDNLIVTSSSVQLDIKKRTTPPPSAPSGFKGPTGAPHVNGPTNPPPNY